MIGIQDTTIHHIITCAHYEICSIIILILVKNLDKFIRVHRPSKYLQRDNCLYENLQLKSINKTEDILIDRFEYNHTFEMGINGFIFSNNFSASMNPPNGPKDKYFPRFHLFKLFQNSSNDKN